MTKNIAPLLLLWGATKTNSTSRVKRCRDYTSTSSFGCYFGPTKAKAENSYDDGWGGSLVLVTLIRDTRKVPRKLDPLHIMNATFRAINHFDFNFKVGGEAQWERAWVEIFGAKLKSRYASPVCWGAAVRSCCGSHTNIRSIISPWTKLCPRPAVAPTAYMEH